MNTPTTLGYDLNGHPYLARGQYRTADGKATIEWSLARHKTKPGAHLFSASGVYDRSAGQCLDLIATAYPSDTTVQEMAEVWRAYHLNDWKGTPLPLAIVERVKQWTALDKTGGETAYAYQARTFLETHGIAFHVTTGNGERPGWVKAAERCGVHFRVTLTQRASLKAYTFDFWGSIADKEKGRVASAYDVLACCVSDVDMPTTLREYCDDFGLDPADPETRETFKRCDKHAKALRAFFTKAQREALREIV